MKNILKIIIALVVVTVGTVLYYISTPQLRVNPPVVVKESIVGCYVVHLQKDIYTLNIQSESKGVVTGIIAFNNYQKDSSSGSFDGTYTGDILLGNYSFDSEGMHSNRQLIFKKVGDNFVEGFGPVKVVGNKELFKDPSTVTYDEKSTFVKSVSCTEHFTDSRNTFTFDHNSYFMASSGQNILTKEWELDSKQNGVLLARVSIPRTYIPKTNFSDARLTVGRSTDTNAIKSCTSNLENILVSDGTKTISGYQFSKFLLGDAGAGNFYNTVSYRGIVDGDCYAIEYTVHSTNIGAYSPDQGIKEFDKSKIQADLEKIIDSFVFLISSN